MCRVNMFCCGCSLTAGAVTASVLQALTTLSYVITGVQFFVIASFFRTESFQSAMNSGIGAVLYNSTREQKGLLSDAVAAQNWADTKEDRMRVAEYMDIGGCITFAIAAIWLFVLICLIVAICRKSHRWVWPWLIGNMVKIVIYCIISLLLAIVSTFYFATVPVLIVAFEIYMWIILLNYYRQLKEPGYQPAVIYKAWIAFYWKLRYLVKTIEICIHNSITFILQDQLPRHKNLVLSIRYTYKFYTLQWILLRIRAAAYLYIF